MITQTPHEEQIAEIVEPVAEALGLELVRVRLMGGEQMTLQIMAERPDGTMDVDACAELSREVSAILDVEDPIDAEYFLEVSTPGIDRPLTREKDFVTWTAHRAKIEMHTPVDGRKRFTGALAGVRDGFVRLIAKDGTESEIPFADIQTAKLTLTDQLIKDAEARSKAAGVPMT